MNREDKIREIERLRKIQEIEALRAQQAQAQDFNDQEAFEGFSAGDRLAVKNFSNSAESAADYLRQKNPDIEVQVKDGEIFGRKKGESQYRALDPNTGFFSKDFLSDAGDVLYDVGSGILEGGATALGGITAGLPGAAGAGAGSSAGLEYLRQKIGEGLGVNKEVDATDVALSGAFGAASPLLLGSGATAKQIAQQGAKRFAQEGGEYATKEAAEQGLKQATEQVAASQRGAIGRIAPKIGALSSGVDRESIELAKREGFDQLDALGNPDVMESFISGKRKEWAGAWNKGIKETGKRGEELIKNSDAMVSLESAAQPYKERLQELMSLRQTGEVVEAIEGLKADFYHRFGVRLDEAMPEVSALDAQAMKRSLGEAGKIQRSGDAGSMKTGLESLGAAPKVDAGTARAAAGNLADALQEAVDGLAKNDGQYKKLKDLQKEIKKLLSTDQLTESRLAKMTPEEKASIWSKLGQADKLLGTDMRHTAQVLRAKDAFNGVVNWRSVPAAALGGSIGYVAGANSGIGQGGAGVGAGVGAGFGALVGGPRAIKQYIKAGRAGRKALDKANDTRLFQPATQSAWNALQARSEQDD